MLVPVKLRDIFEGRHILTVDCYSKQSVGWKLQGSPEPPKNGIPQEWLDYNIGEHRGSLGGSIFWSLQKSGREAQTISVELASGAGGSLLAHLCNPQAT